jgi:molecular chaperone GrpE
MSPDNDTETKTTPAGAAGAGPDGADAEAGQPSAAPADDLATLLKKAEDEALELKDAYLRSRAEIENVRKQGQNDVSKAYRYAIEKFAQDLLEVKDSLEATLKAEAAAPEALRAGVELTLKQLASAFDKVKLVEIDPKGEKFDPHKHQAMSMVDGPEPPNTVAQVFQKGYLLADRVLRPAMVAVTKPKDEAA